MPGQEASTVFRPRPLALSWLLAVGVDLFFNAGLFSGLFDQRREPSLLADEILFRRIPVAYLALALGVTALSWLVGELRLSRGSQGAVFGGLVGATFAVMGTVNLWTAVELTGVFVAGAALVQTAQFAVAGSFLAAYRGSEATGRLSRRAIVLALLLSAGGVLAQNLMGG